MIGPAHPRYMVVTVSQAGQKLATPALSWIDARSTLRKWSKDKWRDVYILDRKYGMAFDLKGARLS